MDEIELTPDQEKAMLEFWNRTPNAPPSLKEITRHIFNGDFDGRSKEGRAIKKALSKHQLRAKASSDPSSIVIELSDAHKDYIVNNAANMNALEIAKIIFANPALTNLHAETRAVNEHIKTLDTRVVMAGSSVNAIPEGDYEPPKTFDKVFRRVNEYLNLTLDKDKLTHQQKKGMEALINYLHTYRFIRAMNNYDTEGDRKSFEDAFIRYTYDKPDLSQEEVDQYIVLANEVVLASKAQRRSERLQVLMEEITGRSVEDMKMSMTFVEAISKAQTEYNQCIKRQQDLLDDLKEKRSAKLSKQIKETSSILSIIEEWKTFEGRQKMLKYVELEQNKVGEEVDKMVSMDELKGRWFGLTQDEIKFG